MGKILNCLKLYHVLALLLLGLIYCSCEHSSKKHANLSFEKAGIGSRTLPELIRIGYDYRNNKDSLSKVCQLLNDSIVENSMDYYLAPLIIAEYERIDTCEKLVSVDWGFVAIKHTDMARGEGAVIEICLDSSKAYVGYDSFDIPNSVNIVPLAEKYLFDADSARWIHEEEVDFFGNIEVFATQMVFFKIDIHIKNGLPIEEWSRLFEYMHEFIVTFDRKRDELSIQKWGQSFDSLSAEKKMAVMKIANYNIIIQFRKVIG